MKHLLLLLVLQECYCMPQVMVCEMLIVIDQLLLEEFHQEKAIIFAQSLVSDLNEIFRRQVSGIKPLSQNSLKEDLSFFSSQTKDFASCRSFLPN